MLADTIGSRPVGTEPNARARAYIVDQLRLAGYDVRVQETDGRRPELGRTARVANIIAVRQGHATKPSASSPTTTPSPTRQARQTTRWAWRYRSRRRVSLPRGPTGTGA